MLSCPSSLQGRSDIPPPVTTVLPVSSDLTSLTVIGAPRRRWDFRSDRSLSVPACRQPYPGSPAGARALCFPAGNGLLCERRQSASSPPKAGLSPHQTLPATSVWPYVTRLHCSLDATACRFGRRPWLGTTTPFQRWPPRRRVEASSTRVLPLESASSLHAQKGNWRVHLLPDE